MEMTQGESAIRPCISAMPSCRNDSHWKGFWQINEEEIISFKVSRACTFELEDPIDTVLESRSLTVGKTYYTLQKFLLESETAD